MRTAKPPAPTPRREFQRARRPEERDQRREAILAAAIALCDANNPIEISLTEIAERAGLSKANLYRYFESREHILLAVFSVDLSEATQAFERRCGAASRLEDVDIASAIADLYRARPRLCRLLALLGTVLETNVSLETLEPIKREIAALAAQFAASLARASALPADRAAWVAQATAVFVAGLWPLANPSPVSASLLTRPELKPLTVDLHRHTAELVIRLLSAERATLFESKAKPATRKKGIRLPDYPQCSVNFRRR